MCAVLAGYGFSDTKLSTNRAGIAVSGDVYGEFRDPKCSRYLFVQVSAFHVARSLSDRPDGVMILAVWREPRLHAQGYTEGPNTWHDANLDSADVALALLSLVGLTPKAAAHGE